ncbi:MAG: 16S rRNA (adenine(1518)-N(6)/adenine(1519)-N(6))-dimethyltransferase RsmA [Candidatus Oxydemutatoraceae bacterium WSBS_2016_MAG_OTU14]
MLENMKPALKHWGQNFLKDQVVIAQLLETISPNLTQNIVEIGPGRGALTQALLSEVQHLDVIEIDKDLAARLKEELGDRITLYREDALKFDFHSFKPTELLTIVGNLPYNISTPLLFHLFKSLERISSMHFMLQLEVAERLVAEPSTKAYSRLSVISQCFVETSIVLEVPPEAFEPEPKVFSAFVLMHPKPLPDILKDQQKKKIFFEIVQRGFSQRRKKMSKVYQHLINPALLEQIGIDPSARAETLSPQQFMDMIKCIHYEK